MSKDNDLEGAQDMGGKHGGQAGCSGTLDDGFLDADEHRDGTL